MLCFCFSFTTPSHSHTIQFVTVDCPFARPASSWMKYSLKLHTHIHTQYYTQKKGLVHKPHTVPVYLCTDRRPWRWRKGPGRDDVYVAAFMQIPYATAHVCALGGKAGRRFYDALMCDKPVCSEGLRAPVCDSNCGRLCVFIAARLLLNNLFLPVFAFRLADDPISWFLTFINCTQF